MNIIICKISIALFILIVALSIIYKSFCKNALIMGIIAWSAINLSALLTTFVPFAGYDIVVRIGFVLSIAIMCVIIFRK